MFRSARFFFTLTVLHVYIGVRVLGDLPISAYGQWLGAAFLFAMFVLMPLGMTARSRFVLPWSDRVTWVGMTLMGLFSSLFVFTLLRDLLLLTLQWFLPAEARADLYETTAIAVVAAALVATLLGFLNARRRARIVRVPIKLPRLENGLQDFSIVQISDLHVGPTIKRGYVQSIVDAVNNLDADVVALTGDFVDGSVSDLREHVAPLAQLRAKYGVYMVLGNHEYYAGEREWSAEFRRLGFRILMNEHVVIEHHGAQLVLAGVTDFSAHHFNRAHRSDPKLALQGAPTDASVKVLLAHQPRSIDAAIEAGFDVQLSGHTHGGQFWPWMYFVRMQQPFTAGLHRVRDLMLYVSRGVGYWGPPNRFGAPSEITHVKLVRS